MKVVNPILFEDLPDYIKTQLEREVDEDLEEEDQTLAQFFKKAEFQLMEYDPSDKEDRETLEYFLNEKIKNEGNPDQSSVDEIGSSGQINDPILIFRDQCCEGRHRMAAALKYNLKIRAIVY